MITVSTIGFVQSEPIWVSLSDTYYSHTHSHLLIMMTNTQQINRLKLMNIERKQSLKDRDIKQGKSNKGFATPVRGVKKW